VDGSKFILLDSTNILNLIPLGEFNITSGMHFQYVDDLVFITDYVSGLIILDVSDPTQPSLVSRYNDGENVRAVNVDQDTVFISCSTDGFKILDISDINNPTLINEISDVGWGMGHIKEGNLIYICDYEEGLRVFDVSDVTAPNALGIYECERVFKVFLKEEHMILLKGGDGMIDIVKIISPMTGNDDTSPILILGGIGAAVVLAAIIVILKKKT
jgi:LPXTG-motif cell wall-anchored protein